MDARGAEKNTGNRLKQPELVSEHSLPGIKLTSSVESKPRRKTNNGNASPGLGEFQQNLYRSDSDGIAHNFVSEYGSSPPGVNPLPQSLSFGGEESWRLYSKVWERDRVLLSSESLSPGRGDSRGNSARRPASGTNSPQVTGRPGSPGSSSSWGTTAKASTWSSKVRSPSSSKTTKGPELRPGTAPGVDPVSSSRAPGSNGGAAGILPLRPLNAHPTKSHVVTSAVIPAHPVMFLSPESVGLNVDELASTLNPTDYSEWFKAWFESLQHDACQFKSPALFVETKLVELLRCEASRTLPTPNLLLTAATCELLDRLCAVLPHAHLLHTLLGCLYSSIFMPSASSMDWAPPIDAEAAQQMGSKYLGHLPYFLVFNKMGQAHKALQSTIESIEAVKAVKENKTREGVLNTIRLWERQTMAHAFRQLRAVTLDSKEARQKMLKYFTGMHAGAKMKDLLHAWRNVTIANRLQRAHAQGDEMYRLTREKDEVIKVLTERVHELEQKEADNATHIRVIESKLTTSTKKAESASAMRKKSKKLAKQLEDAVASANLWQTMCGCWQNTASNLLRELAGRNALAYERAGLPKPVDAAAMIAAASRAAAASSAAQQTAGRTRRSISNPRHRTSVSGGSHGPSTPNNPLSPSSAAGMPTSPLGGVDVEGGIPESTAGTAAAQGWEAQVQQGRDLRWLLMGGETLEELLALPLYQVMLRWANHHLGAFAAATHRRPRLLRSFGVDAEDLEPVASLMLQLNPNAAQREAIGAGPGGAASSAGAHRVLEEKSRRAEWAAEVLDTTPLGPLVSAGKLLQHGGDPWLQYAVTCWLFSEWPLLPIRETVIKSRGGTVLPYKLDPQHSLGAVQVDIGGFASTRVVTPAAFLMIKKLKILEEMLEQALVTPVKDTPALVASLGKIAAHLRSLGPQVVEPSQLKALSENSSRGDAKRTLLQVTTELLRISGRINKLERSLIIYREDILEVVPSLHALANEVAAIVDAGEQVDPTAPPAEEADDGDKGGAADGAPDEPGSPQKGPLLTLRLVRDVLQLLAEKVSQTGHSCNDLRGPAPDSGAHSSSSGAAAGADADDPSATLTPDGNSPNAPYSSTKVAKQVCLAALLELLADTQLPEISNSLAFAGVDVDSLASSLASCVDMLSAGVPGGSIMCTGGGSIMSHHGATGAGARASNAAAAAAASSNAGGGGDVSDNDSDAGSSIFGVTITKDKDRGKHGEGGKKMGANAKRNAIQVVRDVQGILGGLSHLWEPSALGEELTGLTGKCRSLVQEEAAITSMVQAAENAYCVLQRRATQTVLQYIYSHNAGAPPLPPLQRDVATRAAFTHLNDRQMLVLESILSALPPPKGATDWGIPNVKQQRPGLEKVLHAFAPDIARLFSVFGVSMGHAQYGIVVDTANLDAGMYGMGVLKMCRDLELISRLLPVTMMEHFVVLVPQTWRRAIAAEAEGTLPEGGLLKLTPRGEELGHHGAGGGGYSPDVANALGLPLSDREFVVLLVLIGNVKFAAGGGPLSERLELVLTDMLVKEKELERVSSKVLIKEKDVGWGTIGRWSL
eukprot:jgi/Mesvir1/238/Mv13581-RA.1